MIRRYLGDIKDAKRFIELSVSWDWGKNYSIFDILRFYKILKFKTKHY